MTTQKLPSPELLRKLLRYEPETGKLFWLPRDREHFKTTRSWKIWNKRFANLETFTCNDTDGYKIGGIFYKNHKAHRVIWAMQTGEWPTAAIDHINRDRSDNRIENLRIASSSDNGANRASKANSRSKYLGVSWHNRDKLWRARIKRNGKAKTIGYFQCEEKAAMAYDFAAREIHGQFASLNFPDR